jgi:hypothetical protein
MDYQKKDIEIKNLDHLGIVAGLIDEIGIVEIINSKLGIDPREKITGGILVQGKRISNPIDKRILKHHYDEINKQQESSTYNYYP